MDLILSPKDWTGDIPVLSFDDVDELRQHATKFVRTINFNESALVLFATKLDVDYRHEVETILISSNLLVIDGHIENWYFKKHSIKSINLFEFETYKEAFEYCIDLKEGL